MKVFIIYDIKQTNKLKYQQTPSKIVCPYGDNNINDNFINTNNHIDMIITLIIILIY